MKKTAIIYARVSSKRQKEKELPLESQIEVSEAKAASLDARVMRTFIDGAFSGRADDRPDFQAAIDYCNSHQVDYFITWSTSRFARNQFDSIFYKRALDKVGTSMIYVSMDIDRETDSGWLTEGLMELVDEYTSRMTAKDTRRSMERNARMGYWNGGRTPYGYEAVPADDDPKRRVLRILDHEAAIIRRIFELRIAGQGAKNIAAILDDEGHTNRDRKWYKHSVAGILRSDAVCGLQVYGKKDRKTGRQRPREDWTIVRSHVAIIPEDTWTTVQAMMNDLTHNATGSGRSTWLFTGMLRCAHCGSSLQIETAKSGRYSYYNCRANQKHNQCSRHAMRAELMDEFLVETICAKLFSRENMRQIVRDMHEHVGTWATQHRERIVIKEREIAKIESASSKIMDTIEELGPKAVNIEMLLNRLRQHEQKKHAIEGELLQIRAEQTPKITTTEADAAELAAFLVDVIKTNENPRRTRAFFTSFIDQVLVEDHRVVVRYRPERIVSEAGSEKVPSKVIWLPETSLLGTRTVRWKLPEKLRKAA